MGITKRSTATSRSPKKEAGKPSALPPLGAHTSIAGGVSKAFDRAAGAGFDAMQIFVKSNRQWFAPPLPLAEIEAWETHPDRDKLRAVFAHNGYLINLAAASGDVRDNSMRSMREEIIRVGALKLPFIVMHPGAHLGDGVAEGVKRLASALDQLAEECERCKVKLALETTAGQGTTFGHEFAHLRDIFAAVRKPEWLGVCADTAHLLAAGYDFREQAGHDAVWNDFDKTIGINHLLSIHLNDSKVPLASKKDRHEILGEGHIGMMPFARLLQDKRFALIPMVLETPKSEDMHEDIASLEALRLAAKSSGTRS